MIIIKARYTLPHSTSGSGIIGNLFKKVSTKVIDKAVVKSVAQSVADTVAKEAQSVAKTVVQNAVIDSLKRPKKVEDGELTKKRQKLDAIINGSGIVFD